jgi:hypothetical protein
VVQVLGDDEVPLLGRFAAFLRFGDFSGQGVGHDIVFLSSKDAVKHMEFRRLFGMELVQDEKGEEQEEGVFHGRNGS